MSPIVLQTDERGQAKLCSVTDFQVRLALNDMIILTLQYVEKIEQFDAGEYKQLQTVLSPEGALVLAATLKKAAKLLLEPNSTAIPN